MEYREQNQRYTNTLTRVRRIRSNGIEVVQKDCVSMPKLRFHDLRHSCTSLLFAHGVPLKEIQALAQS